MLYVAYTKSYLKENTKLQRTTISMSKNQKPTYLLYFYNRSQLAGALVSIMGTLSEQFSVPLQ